MAAPGSVGGVESLRDTFGPDQETSLGEDVPLPQPLVTGAKPPPDSSPSWA